MQHVNVVCTVEHAPVVKNVKTIFTFNNTLNQHAMLENTLLYTCKYNRTFEHTPLFKKQQIVTSANK